LPDRRELARDECRARLDGDDDGHVIAFLGEMHLAVVEAHVDAQIGIRGEQSFERRRDVQDAERNGNAHFQRPARRRLHAGRHRLGFLRFGDDLRAPCIERAADLRQADAPRRTVEQSDTERLLHPRHAFADDRRGDVEPSRCAREASGFDDACKYFHPCKIHGRSPDCSHSKQCCSES